MNTKHIHFTLSSTGHMQNTVMDSIEESFPVERTALEYDGKLHHFLFLNTDHINDVILYSPEVNAGLPILYNIILNT